MPDVPDLSEFVQPEFLADYKAWYAAVTTEQSDAAAEAVKQ